MNSIRSRLTSTALLLTILCLIGALSSGLGVRLGIWDFRVGFTVLKWSVYLVGVPAALAIAGAFVQRAPGERRVDPRTVIVIAICLAVFVIPYMARKSFQAFPTLADATTSFDDPPVFVDLLTVRAQTGSNPSEYRAGDAIEKQKAHFPELATWESSKPPAEVIQDAARIAAQQGMEVAAVKPNEGRMEATETTFWFRFKDDVVVRARKGRNGTTEVDIRSASRVGYLDGGVNAARVQRLLAALQEA